jgi:hypothetical protein
MTDNIRKPHSLGEAAELAAKKEEAWRRKGPPAHVNGQAVFKLLTTLENRLEGQQNALVTVERQNSPGKEEVRGMVNGHINELAFVIDELKQILGVYD